MKRYPLPKSLYHIQEHRNMNEERKKILQIWSEHLDSIRFERREYGIRKWIKYETPLNL